MATREARKVDERRWRLTIVRHLEDLPRQYAALENAMAAFGDDFDLQQFKPAYNTTEDVDAYNRVQAVERQSNKAIAGALYVTVNTVKTHLTRAYAKLGVHSRAQLARRWPPARERPLDSGFPLFPRGSSSPRLLP